MVEYSEDVVDSVLEQLALGMSIVEICSAEDMPNKSTWFRWLSEKDGLQDRYARAREAQAEVYANEIVEIADNATDANLARLQIDSRKWVASKLLPKKYGDKVEVAVTTNFAEALAQRRKRQHEQG